MNIYLKEAKKKSQEDSRKLSIWFAEEVCLQNLENKTDILTAIKDIHEAGV